MQEQIILPFPPAIQPVRNVRSTILIGSMNVLRASPYADEYLEALAPQHRSTLFDAVAGTWIPVEAAMAHYYACDALHLPVDEQVANGRGTFDRAGATVFGTIVKMARGVGVTPWTLLPQVQRFWDRIYDGGGASVTQLGPKEARIEVVKADVLRSPYYRNALRGLFLATFGSFCTKAYMSERNRLHGEDSVNFRTQWV
jgi:hypothetical protein